MTTEIATYQPGTLAVTADQEEFTDKQRKALEHIGVQDATDGDLQVFFHVCQRTGLDPFARQIYMIGRQSSERDEGGNWTKVTKQTIQTGIDGYRLIGRRAADARRQRISVSAPEWAHEDGTWRPVWRTAWGVPVAARFTIMRDDEPFTAVALFDEYKQTKRGGELTQMWQQRPAGQIAKCAEALAWRMAFPQDLSGIYVEEEMHQAENRRNEGGWQDPHTSRVADLLSDKPEEPVEAEVVDGPDGITSGQLKELGAAMREAGITERDAALAYVGDVIGRQVSSRNELSHGEASRVLDALRQDEEVSRG